IARAWAQLDADAPAFLLADEPVSAMDPAHAVRTMAEFRGMAGRGVGVGLVLHDLSLAARAADHAVLLDAGGRVAAQGPADAVLTEHALSALFDTPIVRGDLPGVGTVLAARSAPPPV